MEHIKAITEKLSAAKNDHSDLFWQYMKFFINGGALGVIALALQALIYRLLGGDNQVDYAVASAITYVPLIFLNFLIQRAWVFKNSGLFGRFVVANLAMMVLVSVLSLFCKTIIDHFFYPPWGERTGFVAAALLGSIPSFLIKRRFVFRMHIKR